MKDKGHTFFFKGPFQCKVLIKHCKGLKFRLKSLLFPFFRQIFSLGFKHTFIEFFLHTTLDQIEVFRF